jgi:hypothetical protein
MYKFFGKKKRRMMNIFTVFIRAGLPTGFRGLSVVASSGMLSICRQRVGFSCVSLHLPTVAMHPFRQAVTTIPSAGFTVC